ncbi:MAG: glycosyltransferase family 1 protein [Candidatus Moraniibacteriota bacterium]
MKIGIDTRCLQRGGKTGVEEYTRGLIKYLAASYTDSRIILFVNSFKNIKEDFSWLEDLDNVEIKKFKFPNKVLNLSFWLLGWPKADKMIGGADIFFVPNFCFISLSRHCKKYLTVHDLSFEKFPETFSLKRRMWHFFINPRKMCRGFDKILAVSDSTAEDVVNLYKITKEKIKVLFPFFDDFVFKKEESPVKRDKILKKYQLPMNYILFLGTIEPRKNIISLVEAFEYWKENYAKNDLKLVIAGKKGWLWKKVFNRIEASRFREDIIFTDFIKEKDKPFIYAGAWLFIYPSYFEGFGFPPLEAMASGVPVITSNCSSLPEVVGDNAILINPYRSYEIYLAINLLLQDKKMYNEYKKKGKNRAKEISDLKEKTKLNF